MITVLQDVETEEVTVKMSAKFVEGLLAILSDAPSKETFALFSGLMDVTTKNPVPTLPILVQEGFFTDNPKGAAKLMADRIEELKTET